MPGHFYGLGGKAMIGPPSNVKEKCSNRSPATSKNIPPQFTGNFPLFVIMELSTPEKRIAMYRKSGVVPNPET